MLLPREEIAKLGDVIAKWVLFKETLYVQKSWNLTFYLFQDLLLLLLAQCSETNDGKGGEERDWSDSQIWPAHHFGCPCQLINMH